MLQNGLVTRLYDRMLFPTPDALKSKYEVLDEKSGKMLHLPHPVSGLRIWNASQKSYERIDPRLGGAPKDGEEESYWAKVLDEFREKQGKDYIDGLLNA